MELHPMTGKKINQCQNPSKEAVLATNTMVSSQALHHHHHEVDSAATTNEVERESGRERNSETADCQQPLKPENTSRLEDSPECLAKSSQISAMSPLLGPSPYSGSVSLRSTSSTASTRSFAFPVLAAEWNGSPVRMVESDQRQSRKRPRWRTCFLCCKF